MANPKPGDKRYRGPVHEAVRNSPLGMLVPKKKKPKVPSRYSPKEAAAKNKSASAALMKKSGAHRDSKGRVVPDGYLAVDTSAGRTFRKKTYAEKSLEQGRTPPSAKAVDAMRYRSATKKSVAKALGKTTKKKSVKKAVTRMATKLKKMPKKAPKTTTMKPARMTRTKAAPKKTGSVRKYSTAQVGRVAAKVAARSGMTKQGSRAKALKILKKRG